MAGRAVTVDLHRDPLVGVPNPVTDDLRVNTAVQCERCVGMPDVVQPDAPDTCEVHEPVEPPGHGIGVQTTSVLVPHQLAVSEVVAAPERGPLVVEYSEVSAEQVHGERVEGDRPDAAVRLAV